MTNKQLAMKAIRQLPDEATLEEIVERVEILAAIQRGEEDIEAGRYITHEEMKRQVEQWLSK
jgi:predicted transcriptional regulator